MHLFYFFPFFFFNNPLKNDELDLNNLDVRRVLILCACVLFSHPEVEGRRGTRDQEKEEKRRRSGGEEAKKE